MNNRPKDNRGSGESSRFRDEPLTDSDLASDKMGRNQLQGDDQESVQNQRRSMPDERDEADGVVESFEKTDKDVRARRDLGKKV